MGDHSISRANLRATRLPPPRTLSSYSVSAGSSLSTSKAIGSTPPGEENGANAACNDGHSGTITAIKYSDNGKMLISASADKTAKVYRMDSNGTDLAEAAAMPPPASVLHGHGKGINDVAWMDGGACPAFAATASDDSSVRLWDVSQGRALRTIWDSDVAFCLASHPTQNVLLAGTVTEKFKILDFRMSAPLVCSVQAHSNVVASIAVDPRGSDFITASLDGTARVWDIGSARCFKSFLSANFAPISHVQFGQQRLEGAIVVSTLAGRHELWSANTSAKFSDDLESNVKRPVEALRRYEGHQNSTHCISACVPSNFSREHPDILVSGSESGEVFFWDLNSEELLIRLDAASAANEFFSQALLDKSTASASSLPQPVPVSSSSSSPALTSAAVLSVACNPVRPHEYAVGVSGPDGYAVQIWDLMIETNKSLDRLGDPDALERVPSLERKYSEAENMNVNF